MPLGSTTLEMLMRNEEGSKERRGEVSQPVGRTLKGRRAMHVNDPKLGTRRAGANGTVAGMAGMAGERKSGRYRRVQTRR